MSRRFLLILPFALTMGIFATFPAQADTVAQARKAIQAAYNQASAAIARKDVNASFAHYAPEFKNISKEGRVSTLQQAKAGATRAFAIAKSVQDKNTITNVRLMGDKAIV